jgi:hypothetical protein
LSVSTSADGRPARAEARHSEKEPSSGRGGSQVAAWITPAFRVPPLPCLRPYLVKISGGRLIDRDPGNTVWRARRGSDLPTLGFEARTTPSNIRCLAVEFWLQAEREFREAEDLAQPLLVAENLLRPGEPWRALCRQIDTRGIALPGRNPAPLSIIRLGGVARWWPGTSCKAPIRPTRRYGTPIQNGPNAPQRQGRFSAGAIPANGASTD